MEYWDSEWLRRCMKRSTPPEAIRPHYREHAGARGTCTDDAGPPDCKRHGFRGAAGIHLWREISAQLLCVTPTAHWLEYADWWNPIVAEPLQVNNGHAHVGDASGSGVAWNEAAVEKYLA